MSVILVCLLVFLIGYIAGKRCGQERGYIKGRSEAPVILREQILQTGICPFCTTDCDRTANSHEKVDK